MHRNKDGCWEHGDWVSENFEFSNVRVNYKPEKDAKIWLRLGVNLTATPQEIEAITKNNDVSLLKSLIAKGNFEIDGDSYIPADSIQEYYDSNPNLQAPDEIGDIEFNI